MFVKIDKKNVLFSIYPQEYLAKKRFLNLKENESANISNKEDLTKNNYNGYYVNNFHTDNEHCVKELFERCQYDLKHDLEHLYLIIGTKYKNENFPTFEQFEKYVKDKELSKDILDKFKVHSYKKYTEYDAICENDHIYTFNSLNIMEYSMWFDNYTIPVPQYLKIYAEMFPNVQAKYCINRIKNAINEKNYEFVYKKLNVVQKSNYYSNYDDFVKFLQENFFENNIILLDDYIRVSDHVYQYDVQVKSADGNDKFKAINLIMTITLKEDADFEIAINKR